MCFIRMEYPLELEEVLTIVLGELNSSLEENIKSMELEEEMIKWKY